MKMIDLEAVRTARQGHCDCGAGLEPEISEHDLGCKCEVCDAGECQPCMIWQELLEKVVEVPKVPERERRARKLEM